MAVDDDFQNWAPKPDKGGFSLRKWFGAGKKAEPQAAPQQPVSVAKEADVAKTQVKVESVTSELHTMNAEAYDAELADALNIPEVDTSGMGMEQEVARLAGKVKASLFFGKFPYNQEFTIGGRSITRTHEDHAAYGDTDAIKMDMGNRDATYMPQSTIYHTINEAGRSGPEAALRETNFLTVTNEKDSEDAIVAFIFGVKGMGNTSMDNRPYGVNMIDFKLSKADAATLVSLSRNNARAARLFLDQAAGVGDPEQTWKKVLKPRPAEDKWALVDFTKGDPAANTNLLNTWRDPKSGAVLGKQRDTSPSTFRSMIGDPKRSPIQILPYAKAA